MDHPARSSRFVRTCLALTALLLALPALALAAPVAKKPGKPGTLTQLSGPRGCIVNRAAKGAGDCARARALDGPGPFMGSRAIALSPNGRHVYVASSGSDAIAIFSRDPKTGALTQPTGKGGCIAAKGADGCAAAIGLDEPNSVAVSADGKNVYATSRAGNSISSAANRSGYVVRSAASIGRSRGPRSTASKRCRRA